MKPYVGATVYYTLSSGDTEAINRRRTDADAYRRLHSPSGSAAGHAGRTGFIAHFGNQVSEADVYPAVIVRDWNEHSGTVNLQVLLDGNDTYWATSRMPGDGPGTWCWWQPPRETGYEPRVPRVGDMVHYVSYGTPGGEFGRECRAAFITEMTQVEANEQDPAGDGIYRESVGLFVASPTGFFLNRGVLPDFGTHVAVSRELAAGEPMPPVMCGDRTFEGGTWHWPAGGSS